LGVSTNLRLSDELGDALRRAAEQRGQSQQQIVRDAIAKELGLAEQSTPMMRAIQSGLLKPPTPHQEVAAIRLPEGTTTLDLLDRDDR
jgi:predicted transcriptional regulator